MIDMIEIPQSEKMPELYTALNAFQAELVTVGKNSDNPFFRSKYASLSDIMLAAQPILTKHGLAVVQLPVTANDRPALTTIITHKSGQSIQGTIELILAKNDPQGVGSAITYYRRYAYAAALQIVIDEDDDGNKASGNTAAKPAQPVKKPVWKTGEPATQMQRTAIKNHLDKLGIEPEAMNEYLTKTYQVTAPLSKFDAAHVLDAMMLENNS